MDIDNQDTNAEAQLAWDCLTTTGVNVFLTGKAGTGKTTFLKRLREKAPKRIVVVAPTGVAAINAGGVTIHSMFQLAPGIFTPGSKPNKDFNMRKEKMNIIKTMDLLVIDEISMVRADLLDAVDAVLKMVRRDNRPFGGLQLLMIGDLQQLSPVVTEAERDIIYANYSTPYFFSSKALAETNYITIELQKVYRQSDINFVELLNKVRCGQVDRALIQELNKRYVPENEIGTDEGYIRLTTHNSQADSVNVRKLNSLKGKSKTYTCLVDGSFPETNYPADKELVLKERAQVMFLKNDPTGQRRYYNGKLGHVSSLGSDYVDVVPEGSDEVIRVAPEEWCNTRYIIDKSTKEISEEVDGTFKQIPLRLAWAITIHKSQGLTFDRAIIDAHSSFAYGQVYVALSRCRTLEGMILSSPLDMRSVMTDRDVVNFVQEQTSHTIDRGEMQSLQIEYAKSLVKELMNFGEFQRITLLIVRLFDEALYKQYPQLLNELKCLQYSATNDVFSISQRFVKNIPVCVNNEVVAIDSEYIERIPKGAKYMMEKISSTYSELLKKSDVPVDNKEVSQRLERYRGELKKEVSIKNRILKNIESNGFSVSGYMKAKVDAILEDEKPEKPKRTVTQQVSTDVLYPKLYNNLRSWRANRAKIEAKPPYVVLPNAPLIAIVNNLPANETELKAIKGVGKRTVESYGYDILTIVKEFKKCRR